MRASERLDPDALVVAIDATSLLGPLTGVGVFTRELLRGLTASRDIDPVAFAVSWRGRNQLPSVVPKGVRTGGRTVTARGVRQAWLKADRPTARSIVGLPISVVHGPNFVVPPGGRGVAEVVTIHDMTAVRYPEMCTADVLQWPALLERALRRGAWVHTVSHYVAEEVRAHFPAAEGRVVAVPNGLTIPPRPTLDSNAGAGARLAGGDEYILALGTVEPRKDLPSLVAAFDALADEHRVLRLVIAGPDGWGADALAEAIDRSPHRNRIVRLGWVDDDQRLGLLRGATVVAYPSRYEGFGLVPLEALAVGTAVVATNVGALPEVLGDAVPLVPPSDVPALAGALRDVITDSALRKDLLERGSERARAFRWDATAYGLHNVYRKAWDAR